MLKQMWEMAAWLVREAADQFYGMCSAVFVVNYSWEFGALWSFVKYVSISGGNGYSKEFFRHVLPASARARVLFPSLDELVGHLGADSLPPCSSYYFRLLDASHMIRTQL